MQFVRKTPAPWLRKTEWGVWSGRQFSDLFGSGEGWRGRGGGVRKLYARRNYCRVNTTTKMRVHTHANIHCLMLKSRHACGGPSDRCGALILGVIMCPGMCVFVSVHNACAGYLDGVCVCVCSRTRHFAHTIVLRVFWSELPTITCSSHELVDEALHCRAISGSLNR